MFLTVDLKKAEPLAMKDSLAEEVILKKFKKTNLVEKQAPPKKIDEISLKGLKLAQRYFRDKKPFPMFPAILGVVAVTVIIFVIMSSKKKKIWRRSTICTIGSGSNRHR